MKILIIGSKGFIGSNCVTYFSTGDHELYQADITPSDSGNYFLMEPANTDFERIFKTHTFDICINASGSANVGFSFEKPAIDFELNVLNVHKLLVAIRTYCPECKFINFSSAAVYGNPVALPISEEFHSKPLSPYGYHKLLSENLLFEYSRFFNLKTCSLRVFSAYGEGLKKQLFWDLYNKSKGNDSINLFGTGLESRDFIYIGDLLSIIEIIIKKATFEGETFNVGNGEEITIQQAVATFFRELNWNGKAIFSGVEKRGDPLNWRADIEKIRKLGYQRKFSFETGIKQYCEWLNEKK